MIKVTKIQLPNNCPSCSNKLEPAWIKGKNQNVFGLQCETCERVYVLYGEGKFLRPAELKSKEE